jgi:hypothetical protein
MGRPSHFASLARLAMVAIFLCGAAQPLAAATRKKRKKPAPAPASTTTATTTVELDAPHVETAPAPAAPPGSPAPPAPPPPVAAHEAAEPAAAASASHAVERAYLPLGTKHTLVLDDLSGFRASTVGGVAYAGPIGFSTSSYNVNVFGANGTVAGTDTINSTTLWVAPSADYFLLEHLSIGGVIELAYNTSNYNQTIYNTTTHNPLPPTTSFTVIPRAGWMFDLARHWGVWPRLGLGFGVLQENAISQAGAGNATTASTSTTFLLDVDVGVIYRMDPRFFLRAGPDFTWGPGASLVDLSIAFGFGYLWSI